MNKKLMLIPHFFVWLFYFFLTMKERNEYIVSVRKGQQCVDSYDSSRFIYGAETTYVFDPMKKPKRNYMTWKEFWKSRGY